MDERKRWWMMDYIIIGGLKANYGNQRDNMLLGLG